MLSQLLLPYLRTGRSAEAVEAHKTAYALIRDNRHYLDLVGLHLQFCGLTGNQEHGLPIIERHLPWLDRPASTFAAMEFASAAALVLRRLSESGQPDVAVRRRTDSGDRRWTTTVTETYDEMVTLARSLASQFDKRNGNSYQSTRVEERLRADPVVPELPLTVLRGRPIAEHPGKATVDRLVATIAELTAAGDIAGAARARLEVAYTLRNAGQWGDAMETAEEAQRSLDLAGLTDEAMIARHLLVELYSRSWQQRRTAYTMLDELLAAPSLPAALPSRAELLEQAAGLAAGPRAVEHLMAAADLHRTAGAGEAETRCLRDALRRATEPPPNWAELVARLDGDDLVEVQELLCRLEGLAGRPEAAVERARRYPGDHPQMRLREAHLLLRAEPPRRGRGVRPAAGHRRGHAVAGGRGRGQEPARPGPGRGGGGVSRRARHPSRRARGPGRRMIHAGRRDVLACPVSASHRPALAPAGQDALGRLSFGGPWRAGPPPALPGIGSG